MFDIHYNGPDICLVGRLDAAQAGKAREFFAEISVSQEVDFDKLDYISSAGLGVLLSTQKRLGESGHSLRLKNLNGYIRDVFRYAGFDTVFEIDESSSG